MKKILVMSDTHGYKGRIQSALLKYGEDADIIVHLGDYVSDAEYLKTITNKKVYSLKGNCDITSAARQEILIRTGGKKILALHGHKQNVKSGIHELGAYAAEKGADLALFGHTHIPLEEYYGDVLLYNPGSLGEPKGRKPTVGIVTIDDGKITIASMTV